jgi:hypothetical protein
MRLLLLASFTAERAVLAATRSMDKIVITSRGSAFAAAPSDIGSEDANAASAETSTLFFLLDVAIHMIAIISTITNQNIDAYIIADQPGLLMGNSNKKSYHANYFAPHLFLFFIFMSIKFSDFLNVKTIFLLFESFIFMKEVLLLSYKTFVICLTEVNFLSKIFTS